MFRRRVPPGPMQVWSVMLGTFWDAMAHLELTGLTIRHVVTR
jgi:hypothetical protein